MTQRMELPSEDEVGGKKKAKGPKTALMYAVDLLARQEQSSAKLREKLGKAAAVRVAEEFSEESIQKRLYDILSE